MALWFFCHTRAEASLSHLEEAALTWLLSGSAPHYQSPPKIFYLPRLCQGVMQALSIFAWLLSSSGPEEDILPLFCTFLHQDFALLLKGFTLFPIFFRNKRLGGDSNLPK